MSIFLLSLLFIVIITVEVPRLLRQRMYRELWAFGGVTLLAMVWSFGVALKLPVPNVTKGIEAVVRPVFLAFERLLTP
ncbi:MAG: hypothetical protein QMC81_03045 [Thermoanaerobacterales bacterium]|nr:hypothetical protein [Bacillota bacterium]MDI6906455.1 hypothetical protein [Thermoanaerobacterales bacterium]